MKQEWVYNELKDRYVLKTVRERHPRPVSDRELTVRLFHSIDSELADFVTSFLGEIEYGRLEIYRRPNFNYNYPPIEWRFTYFDFATHLVSDGIACTAKGIWQRNLSVQKSRQRKVSPTRPSYRLGNLKSRLQNIPKKRQKIIQEHGLHILTELNGSPPEQYHTPEELDLMHTVGYPYDIPIEETRPLLKICRKGKPKKYWKELGLV